MPTILVVRCVWRIGILLSLTTTLHHIILTPKSSLNPIIPTASYSGGLDVLKTQARNPPGNTTFHTANTSDHHGSQTATTMLQQQNHQQLQQNLSCLQHQSRSITTAQRIQANHTTLEHQKSFVCGQLHRQWLHNPPLSPWAQRIHAHQWETHSGSVNNDSSSSPPSPPPLATHYMDNVYGLGAHLILWGETLCHAIHVSTRLVSTIVTKTDTISNTTQDRWIWQDEEYCGNDEKDRIQPLHCYFPKAEPDITTDGKSPATLTASVLPDRNATDPRTSHCPILPYSKEKKQTKNGDREGDTIMMQEERSHFRAAVTEFLFSSVSPLVIQEAKRQMGIVFQEFGGAAPPNLVTLHIRWGDKFWEMDLPNITEYIEAVKTVTAQHYDNGDDETVHIYLSTEDPRAYQAFLEGMPKGWKVYPDVTLEEINAFRPVKGNRASWATRNTQGRAGLVALGSLLVAMEADAFVLTTRSNWSTLMNHLRTNIVDPRCGNCTKAIDLRPFVY